MSALWNWCVAERVDAARIRAAIAEVLDRPVGELGATTNDGLLCDVWYVGGDFPTLVDVFLAPADRPEPAVASDVAVRLGAAVLLPDETLNPTRYVLAAPDGTSRSVHVDETETDDGTERRHLRPCTGSDPACALAPERNAA
jgi:hypothetical protein